jgi:hypothetical protein
MLVGVLELAVLGLCDGDRAGDVVLLAVEPGGRPRSARVILTNRDVVPVVVGMLLRRPGPRLWLEGGCYVRNRTRSRRADLLARRQTTIGVLAGGETGTFVVRGGADLGQRVELVAVVGQRDRLRAIHRLVQLPRGRSPYDARAMELLSP